MEQVLFEVKRLIVGQDHVVERLLVALLARGHVLLEGVPWLAKTAMIKALAQTVGGAFGRQFTPTSSPPTSSARASSIVAPASSPPSLGPLFVNLLLADEINRAPAKVQSALLEVMQERADHHRQADLPRPRPFLVLATQNPLESDGTYPPRRRRSTASSRSSSTTPPTPTNWSSSSARSARRSRWRRC